MPLGILLFAIYQFLQSLGLILGGLNSFFEIAAIPEEAVVGAEMNREGLMILQLLSIVIGIWGLLLAINLFKLNDKARRRLLLYTKIILIFAIILFLLGIIPMILIILISLIILRYLNSKKVKRAFGVVEYQASR